MLIEKSESKDPKEHAQNIEKYLTELKKHCREDLKKFSDAKAQALFETAADVLDGLEKAFSDYQSENEAGWIQDENRPPVK